MRHYEIDITLILFITTPNNLCVCGLSMHIVHPSNALFSTYHVIDLHVGVVVVLLKHVIMGLRQLKRSLG